eukprot:CAMPEP_0119332630 /NCGR_PEP_ID=MMETSP1333-20130426/83210_1 /TAXON_ID=418940 /ORGANISM="Scyphosphaera apsteinii, Strain RCC1455" /LENGTH=172 /DNA_ID=CAMNT_0007342497 /DNA_START=12 /DNA_END=526 /DNA_ORIENTATION=-
MTEVARTISNLREELDYQLAKGVSDPRFRDADDAADLQRCMLKARGALQRYVDLVEKRSASGSEAVALRLRGGLCHASTAHLLWALSAPRAADYAKSSSNQLADTAPAHRLIQSLPPRQQHRGGMGIQFRHPRIKTRCASTLAMIVDLPVLWSMYGAAAQSNGLATDVVTNG